MLNLNFNFDGLKHLWEWWPVVKSNLQSIQSVFNAHAAGTADKHNSQDINYTGSVPGKSNVKEAVDETYERIDYLIEQTILDPGKDPEVVDARVSTAKEKTFASVKARHEETEADVIAHKADYAIDIKQPGYGLTAAVGDGATDDYAAVQAIIDYALVNNKNIYFPSGTYKISDTLTIDRTAIPDEKINIIGAGSPNVRINYTGSEIGIYMKGYPSGDGYNSRQTISGLTLVGTNATGKGISLKNSAYIKLDDVYIAGFDYGLYMEGVEQSSFEKVMLQWNNKGLHATVVNFVEDSGPNNLSFYSCTIGNNFDYGAYIQYPTTVNFFGGDIEANGTSGVGDNYGIQLYKPGYQGGVACNFVGVYFESNGGIADVWFKNDANEAGIDTSAIYSVIGCTFQRATSDRYATNNILCTFTASTAEQQKLSVINSSFKSFGTYVPDAGRKYIAFNGDAMSVNNCEAMGNIYMSDLEDSEIPVKYKVGLLTRDTAVATGNVAYTGVGFKPKKLTIYGQMTTSICNGATDGYTAGSTHQRGSVYESTINLGLLSVDSTNYIQIDLVSFDNDGFTLSFTKTNSPTGMASIRYVVEG
jgi:hypothetical protein